MAPPNQLSDNKAYGIAREKPACPRRMRAASGREPVTVCLWKYKTPLGGDRIHSGSPMQPAPNVGFRHAHDNFPQTQYASAAANLPVNFQVLQFPSVAIGTNCMRSRQRF